MDGLDSKILEVLRNLNKPIKARTLATELGVTRKEVNSLLYGKLSPCVAKIDGYLWTLRDNKDQTAKAETRQNYYRGLDRAQCAFLVRSLTEFTFPTRVQNLITDQKLSLVLDLATLRSQDLRELPNVGSRTISEIDGFLRLRGLELSMPIDLSHAEICTWLAELADEIAAARRMESLSATESFADASQTLSGELRAFTFYHWKPNSRNAELTVSLCGWDGTGAKTLEEIGVHYKMTRERVRQIRVGFLRRIKGKLIDLPKTKQAWQILLSRIPCSEEDLAKELVDAKLIEEKFDLSGLLAAAQLLHPRHGIIVKQLGGTSFFVKASEAHKLATVKSTARALISKQGCAHVEDLASRCEWRGDIAHKTSIIRRILTTLPDIHWLSPDNDWFTLSGNARNRLRNALVRILSVSDRVPIGEMREALKRFHRLGGAVPPTSILGAFCNTQSFCRQEGGAVLATTRFNPDETLGKTELLLSEVLREAGGVMSGMDFQRNCLARGLNENTFFQYLTYSPIVLRIARAVYALPGATIPPGTIEELSQERERRSVLEDHGWLRDGRFWIAYRLNPSNLRSGTFTVPAAAISFMQGALHLNLGDGLPIDEAKVTGDRLSGLRHIIRVCGAEDDDLLRLTINLQSRMATVSIIDEDSIDEPNDPALSKEDEILLSEEKDKEQSSAH